MWVIGFSGFTALTLYITAYIKSIEFGFHDTSKPLTIFKVLLLFAIILLTIAAEMALIKGLERVLDKVAKARQVKMKV